MEHTHVVDGLRAPVEVVYDRWGVPHVRAHSADDAFVAQGFTAARDRLFQLDLWRRRGLGLLSEVLGQRYLEQDRAARLFLYRGDMDAEWAAYGEGVREVAERFTAGINTYVGLTELEPALLGPEFDALGFTPSRWAPEDLARIRSHGLYANAEKELARAITLRDLGPEAEDLRAVREPEGPLDVPEGLDLDVFHPGVLDVYRLACSPVDLTGIGTPPGTGAPSEPAHPSGTGDRPGAGERPAPLEPDGSNNWVIGAERTATGRPILANDPHRAIGSPALRYISHLSCPEFDVIGAGEPALPGISIGHNGRVAFGLTVFPVDQEDLYVYELHPDDPGRYRYRGGWRAVDTVTEHVPVRGGPDQEVKLDFTVHGPLVHTDRRRRAAFAVRAAWLGPGMAPYLGSVQYMRARDSRGFRDAMRVWGAPGENQVYADAEGFGWIAAGRVPVRPNWDGTLPVPGDGSHEWAGFHSGGELPAVHRPEQGWFASANEHNTGRAPGWKPFTVTRDWAAPLRYERIAEELSARTDWTVQDACRLQNDHVSPAARAALAVLDQLPDTAPGAAEALELLRGRSSRPWDGTMAVDLPQPTLFEHWFRRRLRPALLHDRLLPLVGPERVGEAVRAVSPDENVAGDPRTGLRLLAEAVLSEEGRSLVARTLGLAYLDLVERHGPPGAAWHWGEHHFARLDHPLARAGTPPAWAEGRRVARPGSADTVDLTAYDGSGRQYHGASFRIVVDVGDWDGSVAVNAPGQSGDPRSPHHDDLTGLWSRGRYFPLLYSREAVDRHRETTLRLLPRTTARTG
ncbi:penicillin acylase family protein [Nocardiopsis ganjiahuensis]|uniref:penicillin acylase family protein n=1 Tax=Nocardiopsis ganjiahuensis TaxID=239984 RepID=UPI00034CEBBF|nr:penicillin acylase family protein [Nocardiopsis ganjiahuensis]